MKEIKIQKTLSNGTAATVTVKAAPHGGTQVFGFVTGHGPQGNGSITAPPAGAPIVGLIGKLGVTAEDMVKIDAARAEIESAPEVIAWQAENRIKQEAEAVELAKKIAEAESYYNSDSVIKKAMAI
jgi:hypothetical protein